jgi:hypothetical protein
MGGICGVWEVGRGGKEVECGLHLECNFSIVTRYVFAIHVIQCELS